MQEKSDTVLRKPSPMVSYKINFIPKQFNAHKTICVQSE